MLLQHRSAVYGNTQINLLLDDGRKSIQTLETRSFDLIWLDAFSCDVNPELWSWQFLQECFRIMRLGGALLTYSSAPCVRGGLFKAGFTVGETPSFGRRRSGTVAIIGESVSHIEELAEKERHIIFDSTAGTPYSDPGLNHTAEWMIQHHKNVVDKLRKRGVPKWYKNKK